MNLKETDHFLQALLLSTFEIWKAVYFFETIIALRLYTMLKYNTTIYS